MVLKEENDHLRESKQLLQDRITKLEEWLESYKDVKEGAQKMETLFTQLLKAHEDRSTLLEQQLKVKTDQNTELTKKVAELQSIIDGQAA